MFGSSSRSIANPAAGKARAMHARPAAADSAWTDEAVLLARLDTTAAGLDEEQIEDRLDRDGVNQATHEKPPHWTLQ
ncbi:MAG: cation-transporting P-type ATPase, partial [Rhodanobacteraceae bacterium]